MSCTQGPLFTTSFMKYCLRGGLHFDWERSRTPMSTLLPLASVCVGESGEPEFSDSQRRIERGRNTSYPTETTRCKSLLLGAGELATEMLLH